MARELDVTVGIIGGGSMGGAIARGLVESATLPADRVLVADPDPARREGFSELGIHALEAALPGARVVRVMPNLPVQVRSGATAVAGGASATRDDVELTCALFSALGSVAVMREDQLDVSGAVVGTAPAFFSLFVDALTRAAVLRGLPAASARELVETTMRGCAEQLLNEGVHPREYMERVTSPGGTTAAALRELEPALLAGTSAAVDAALARTRELA